jgi:predicted metal-binding transcription factor (methanogenesis marker protein 9)
MLSNKGADAELNFICPPLSHCPHQEKTSQLFKVLIIKEIVAPI